MPEANNFLLGISKMVKKSKTDFFKFRAMYSDKVALGASS